jgi:CheY-like chemotaxis protein
MSSSYGPVIFVEDDLEDHEFMLEAYQSLGLRHGWKLLTSAHDALHYLRTTSDKPFIIISEITLRGMDGIGLRKAILKDEQLRKKSIPFVFFTTNYDLKDVEQAYDLEVQGYFIKKYNIPDTARMLQKIIDYWTECYHPNNAR